MLDKTELTLGEFLKRWLSDYASQRFRSRTLDTYRAIIERHIIPSSMSGIGLTSLNPAHFQSYYRQALDGGLSDRVVFHLHHLLVTALKDADKMGVDGLPKLAIEFPRFQHPGPTRRTATAGDRPHSSYIGPLTFDFLQPLQGFSDERR